MSLRKEIKSAYDTVYAPDDLIERLKQDLYQKDFHEEDEEEVSGVADAPRPSFSRIMIYIAACAVLCIGCGFSVWTLRDKQNEFHPNSPVVVSSGVEDTTETTENTTELQN